uniref:Uncharacterized protein n=1 Tax=Glossina brevipalpis TaxID=37001 RepID=A0A1A9WAY6_9MUSC
MDFSNDLVAVLVVLRRLPFFKMPEILDLITLPRWFRSIPLHLAFASLSKFIVHVLELRLSEFGSFVTRICISNLPRLSVIFVRGGGGGGGAFNISSLFVVAQSQFLGVIVLGFVVELLLSNILLLINVPLSNNLIIVLLTSGPSTFDSNIFASSFTVDVKLCFPTGWSTYCLTGNIPKLRTFNTKRSCLIKALTFKPFCSASLFLSTLDTKKPVPNSLPPRTVNPKVGVVPGTTKIRRICGLIKRTIRMRDDTENAHQDEADVVNVNISLDELVVDSLKLLLQSVNNAVAISTCIEL